MLLPGTETKVPQSKDWIFKEKRILLSEPIYEDDDIEHLIEHSQGCFVLTCSHGVIDPTANPKYQMLVDYFHEKCMQCQNMFFIAHVKPIQTFKLIKKISVSIYDACSYVTP